MRNTSETMLCDDRLKELFHQLADNNSFHKDDADEVYARYVARAETLIANDLKRAFNESLHAKSGKRKVQKLEQLRSVKKQKNSESKLVSNGEM